MPLMPRARDAIVRALEKDMDVKAEMMRTCLDSIHKIANILTEVLRNNGRIILFGNGGSAADAQHLAGEFVGRFMRDRPALPAISLGADSAVMSCLANDYGYHQVFARQIEGLVDVRDVCIGITTSGTSHNVILALEKAQAKGASTIAVTGEKGEGLSQLADILLVIPSAETYLIQQGYMAALHCVCQLVEEEMFGESDAHKAKVDG